MKIGLKEKKRGRVDGVGRNSKPPGVRRGSSDADA